jgi:hypothetical protein
MLNGGMLIGEGDFKLAEETLDQAIEASKKIGDTATRGLSMSVLGWCLFVQGKFEKSVLLAEEMQSIGKNFGDERFDNWGLLSNIRDKVEVGKEVPPELVAGLAAYEEKYGGKMLQSDKVTLLGLKVKLAEAGKVSHPNLTLALGAACEGFYGRGVSPRHPEMCPVLPPKGRSLALAVLLLN